MEDEAWLVVGKPKKVKTGEIKVVEDDLELMSQVTKQSRPVNGTKKEKPSPAVVKKTQIPKLKPQEKKKKTESPARVAFKSLQVGLNSLNLVELRNLLDATKLQFNNDVILLKTILQFLNENLRLEKTEDLMLFDKPLNYPASILPADLKSILESSIGSCSNETLSYFFHNLLQSLCEELNKSRNFSGHLILLQQISHHCPIVATANLASTVILKNSYQNQPSICCLLFWALGTSAFRDTTTGLRVWLQVISSVVTVKSYTKFAFDFLHKILSGSDSTPDLEISVEEFKSIVEVLLATDIKVGKSKDLQKIKAKCVEILTMKFVASVGVEDIEEVFVLLLQFSKRSPELFVQGLIGCVARFAQVSLEVWGRNFDLFSRQNVFIFKYLENNLKEAERMFNLTSFTIFIKNIDYEKYPNLNFIKDIPAKMTEGKKQKKTKKNSNGSSGSCCRWFLGSFLLFGTIAGLITYDTQVLHGGKFEESSVGRVLKQAGALPHVENAWFVSLKYSARGYKFLQEQAPVAYGKTKTFLEPYCDFAKDLGLTAFNGAKKGWESTKIVVAEKVPVVVEFIDKYVPGLGQKIHDFVVNASKGFCSLTCNGWRQSVEFFKTKVFIGTLSPENLGKAFNSTTQRALTYYSWFHEKVDFYAKIK